MSSSHLIYFSVSIHFPALRVSGSCWSMSQLSSGAGVVTLSPVYHVERQTATHTHSYGQFSVLSLPHVHVIGLWEEAGVP